MKRKKLKLQMSNISSSFRDPSGFIFLDKDKNFKRQINLSYKENYDFLKSSGLLKKLTDEKLLISHKEIKTFLKDDIAYKIIRPKKIPFITYPYEWSFSQLKDAALLTLKIQKIALEFGMSLKDASGFNIQFLEGRPILIDTLSFEKYAKNEPWIAYKQFCEHFLAPLVLAKYKDPYLIKLLQTNVNGIPLSIARQLLPFRAKLHPMIFIHVVLHSRNQTKNFGNKDKFDYSKKSFTQLIESLEDCIKILDIKSQDTKWSNYYEDCSQFNYGDKNLKKKKELVGKFLRILKPKLVWDLGANTGFFSKIASDLGAYVVSMDNDWAAVENCYKDIKKEKRKNILPLVVDITNPTPSIGWGNAERESLFERPRPDTILALALIHHLAIGNNLPFKNLAEFFAKQTDSLIIEFVPKKDPQVQTLFANREDIFLDYTEEVFEKEFGKFFKLKGSEIISKSQRKIYLYEKN